MYGFQQEISGYGVVLKRITHDCIERIRQWRNNPKVSQYMLTHDYITPEMQETWFQKIDNDETCLHFIIMYDNREMGVINVSNIDEVNHSCEGGIYLNDVDSQNADIAYRSHLVLYDYIMKKIGINNIHSCIYKSNKRAIRLAEYIGNIENGETHNGEMKLYVLTRYNYFNNSNRLRFINKWNKLNNIL